MARAKKGPGREHPQGKCEEGAPDPDLKNLPPPTRSARLLPLERMHHQDFKYLCNDLVEAFPDVRRAELKRSSGIEQFGVDVEGFDDHQAPSLVLSAKRYQRVTPSKLKSWGDDFLDEWDGHWKDKGVRTFVLAVTVELNDDRLNEAIRTEAARFARLRITYEVWGLKQLTSQLREQPGMIARYFHPAWVEILCGFVWGLTAVTMARQSLQPVQATGGTTDGLGATAEVIRDRYGVEIARGLEEAKARLGEGVTAPLRDRISSLRSDLVGWDNLPAANKAEILRAEASLALRDKDLVRARALRRDALAYAPPRDRTGDVLLHRLKAGSAAALDTLPDAATKEEAHVRAALLIEVGRPQDVEAVLDRWTPDDPPEPEAFRLRALARGMRRRDDEAPGLIGQAEATAPRQSAPVAWTAAVLRFAAALSPAAPFIASEFPDPVPPGLVREDDQARTFLDEAERAFDRLARAVDGAWPADLEVWRLACLLCNSARRDDARRFARSLLERPVPHPGAVAWALTRGLEFRHDDVVKSLTKAFATGQGGASHAVAAAAVHLFRGADRRAMKIIEKARSLFGSPADVALLDFWTLQIAGPAKAGGGDPAQAGLREALTKLLRRGDPADVLRLLDADDLDAEQAMGALEALAARRRWAELFARRDRILAFGTARSVELTAAAALEAGEPAVSLLILGEHRDWFAGGRLPHQLRLVEAKAHFLEGRPDLALALAEAVQQERDDGPIALEVARMRIGIGDLAGAADLLRRAQHRTGLPGGEVLQTAWHLRREDPQLARELVGDVDWERLHRRAVPAAFALALELGLGDVQAKLFPKIQAAARSRSSGVFALGSVEEVIALIRRHEEASRERRERWLAAEMPGHLAFEGEPLAFAELYLRPFEEGPALSEDGRVVGLPFLVRSGHLRHRPAEPASSVERLRLDLSAVLVGQALGLLDKLHAIAAEVWIPAELPEAITDLEHAVADSCGPIAKGLRALLAALDAGSFRVIPEIPDGAGREPRLSLDAEMSRDAEDTVHLADVLRALVKHEHLDPSWAAGLLHRLDLAPASESGATPQPSTVRRLRVVLADALRLASGGELGVLSRFLDLGLAEVEVTVLHQQAAANERRRRFAARLKEARVSVAAQLRLPLRAWRSMPPFKAPREAKDLEQASPVTRGLASLTDERTIGAATVSWIEDRAVSAIGSIGRAPVVDVVWILERLRGREALDEASFRAAVDRLVAAGYGYRMPDMPVIAAALREAAVVEGEVIENGTLAAIRVDYAVQLAMARHLTDKMPGGPPAEGEEMRFLARLVTLVADVMPVLWSDPALSPPRRIALSWWAWRALRTEQASFFSRQNPSSEAKRALAFMGGLSLVTAVFHVAGEGRTVAQANRRAYLSWAFAAIVDPLVALEPEFEDVLANHVAHGLSGLFETDDETRDLSPKLLAAFVAKLLEAFPEAWQQRIRSREPLRDRLAVRTVERVTLDPGLEFEAKDFFAGLEAVIRSGAGPAHVSLAGTDATASFERASDGLASVTVRTGTKTVHLGDDATLAHPDAGMRRSALQRNATWFDLPPAQRQAVVDAIAAAPTTADRFARLQATQEGSLPWRMERLAEQIREERRTERALLAPSPPEVLMVYLRLPTDFPNEVRGLATAGAEALLAEFGPLEALRRLAGIPTGLPSPVNEAAALVVAEKGSFDAGLKRVGETPLNVAALTRVTRLYANSATVADSGSALGRLAAAFERKGRLFLAVLRWTFRAAAQDPAWTVVAEPARSALLWCHANAVMEVLVAENVVPSETSDILDHRGSEGLVAAFVRARGGGDTAFDPAALTTTQLAAAIALHALGGRRRPDQRC